MAKIIYGAELGKIVGEICSKPERYFDDPHDALSFIQGIAEHVSNAIGGQVGNPDFDMRGKGALIAMHIDERVAPDGGIWNKYDKDVTWKEGKEIQK